ncbi:MAG: tetratricopeptide repeat protein, partial [Myxococcales bacterium]|nr:tetratricopeptide repeat protein [Myxococcales bacterium]
MDRALDTRLLRFRSDPSAEDPSALARELMRAGRGPEAMEVAGEGLRSNPRNAVLLVVLGKVLLDSGDLVRAQAALLEAAKGAHPPPDAFRYLGEVLLHRGDHDRAAKVLARARALAPDDPQIRELHGRATKRTRSAEVSAPPRAEVPGALPKGMSPPSDGGRTSPSTAPALLSGRPHKPTVMGMSAAPPPASSGPLKLKSHSGSDHPAAP